MFDMDDFRRELTIHISFPKVALILLAVVIILWLVFGGPFYIVGPDEEGIIQTFGKYTSSTSPGFHFKFPWPIQTVIVPKVKEIKRLEVGFRTKPGTGSAQYEDATNSSAMLREAQMLTGDENVVNNSMIVQYKIKNAVDYVFNVKDQEGTLHDLAEAAERQVVGNRPIDDTLTTGKTDIQLEVLDKIQAMADQFGLGVTITAVQLQDVQPPGEVAAAFKDVATAKEDRDGIINTARGYQNEKIPQARGKAAQLLRESEGYERERVAMAEGDASRFLALAEEYKKAPAVTRERLYLETMKSVLPRVKKVIVDDEASIVNLNQLNPTGAGK
jgi:membrane protease subunit HflK